MTIPDIIYALHEDIITRDEARHLIDALAHMELSVGLDDRDGEDELIAALEITCGEHGHDWQGDTAGGICSRCGAVTIDRAAHP